MHGLQEYNSDSCSDISEGGEHTADISTTTAENENLSSADYFNIDNTSEDSTSSASCSFASEYKETLMVATKRKRATDFVLPEGDFWRGKHDMQDFSSDKQWGRINPVPPKRARPDNGLETSQSLPHGSMETAKRAIRGPTVCLPATFFHVTPYIGRHLGRDSRGSKYPCHIHHCIQAHHGVVNRVSWCCPQFSHLLLTCSMDNSIKIWDAFCDRTTPVAQAQIHNKAVKVARWTHSGRQTLSCSYDRTAKLYDVETGQVTAVFPHHNYVTALALHPADHSLFVTGSLNELLTWDMRTPHSAKVVFRYKDKFGQVQDAAYLHGGRELVTCNDLVSRDSSDRNVMVWDTGAGVAVSNQVYHERYTCCRVLAHPHGHQFVTQSSGDYLALFSAARPYKMNTAKRYQGHKTAGYSVGCGYSTDGRLLYSGSSAGELVTYDVKSTRLLDRLKLGSGAVTDVEVHPLLHGTVAACTWDGDVTICQS